MSSNVTILGSTGSIGISSLRVIKSLDKEFAVYGLSCNKNLGLLEEQISEFHPRIVAVGSEDIIKSKNFIDLKKRYPDVEFLENEEGIIELSGRDVDILISAIVGSAGLKPTLNALPHVKRLALANKETLVIAGDIFIEKIKQYGVELIPIDSEHNAIFTLIQNIEQSEIEKIILTASGGSLKNKTIEELNTVSPEEALAHPTWDMGDKITIDSATLMNKGFEVIESHYLFNIDYDSIDVIIHPESIIHSMVETIDGAILAHMGIPDMVFPILSALTYPQKRKNPFGRLDLTKIGNLSFHQYDSKRFPALDLCYHAGRTGGTMPAVLNAANEIAVDAFLKKRIFFQDIVKIVEKIIELHKLIANPGIDDIFNADTWAREKANSLIKG